VDQRVAAGRDAEHLPGIPDIGNPDIVSGMHIDSDRSVAALDQALRDGMAKTPSGASDKHVHSGK
jgi:hypothetical protein